MAYRDYSSDPSHPYASGAQQGKSPFTVAFLSEDGVVEVPFNEVELTLDSFWEASEKEEGKR